jgi:uncharacterized protein (TIGR04141 family)
MGGAQTISVYLLKAGISSPAAALKGESAEGLRVHAVKAGETEGTLYVSQGDDSPPEWVGFLAGVTAPPVAYQTRSLSAVLLLSAANRWFAITFGYGRRLLDPEAYERDFGLLCALNGVDPEKLRGAEARTFDDYALHTLKQLSRLSTISSLELNTDRELVVSLAGQLDDQELGRRIDGRDAVRLTADLTPDQLRGKCAELLRESEKKDYEARFPFFDTIKRVRDPAEVERLERKAFEELGKQQFSQFDLFPPQIVSNEIRGFEFSIGRHRTRVIEPHSGLLGSVIRGPQSWQQVALRLRRLSLRGIDEKGDVAEEWSFFKCLHWEYHDGNAVHVLDGGQWYRIDPTLVADVEQFASSLSSSGIAWPPAGSEQTEGEYNAQAAADLGCALLDKAHLIRLHGQTPVEPCDLFTSDRQFVHVKRRKGGSGPLSHLFGQAVVSAEGFVKQGEFRELFRKALEEALPGYGIYSPANAISSEYAIVLGLIAKPSQRKVAEELPFFSKVTLRLAVKQLTSMNFDVYVDRIPIAATVPTGIPVGEAKMPRRSRSKRSTPAPAPAQRRASRQK